MTIKHQEKLINAAATEKVHIIGFTNYGWNENLNLVMGNYLRAKFPDVLMIAGGPNLDPTPENRRRFLNGIII